MSQPNAWQTANRNRNSQSSSRTPTNRSGTASPNPHTSGAQQSKPQENNNTITTTTTTTNSNRQPPGNVWTQRSSTPASGSNGPPRAGDVSVQPVNDFNAQAVKAFLSRDALPAPYKPQDAPDSRTSGGAWGAKASQMANGQQFFSHLSKQIATSEGGG